MSEQDTLEVHIAFERFATHVTALSSPHGAAAAISTARRRRRGSFSALAAVAVLATGAIAATSESWAFDGHPAPASSLRTGSSRQGPAHVRHIDPRQTLGEVWPEALQPALAGWDTSWSPRLSGPSGPGVQSFCPGAFDDKAAGRGETVNVGHNGGEWVKWFSSETEATEAIARLREHLAACPTPFQFHTVVLPDGRRVVVGLGQGSIWIERVASHVLVLHLPSGSTPPPDAVSVKIGGVLEHVLEQPATTTISPDAGTRVSGWMRRAIAAAPTFGP